MGTVLKQIKQAIHDSDLSRYRIAQESGVSESALSRLMSGEQGLGIDAIEKVAHVLGLEIVVRLKRRRRKSK